MPNWSKTGFSVAVPLRPDGRFLYRTFRFVFWACRRWHVSQQLFPGPCLCATSLLLTLVRSNNIGNAYAWQNAFCTRSVNCDSGQSDLCMNFQRDHKTREEEGFVLARQTDRMQTLARTAADHRRRQLCDRQVCPDFNDMYLDRAPSSTVEFWQIPRLLAHLIRARTTGRA